MGISCSHQVCFCLTLRSSRDAQTIWTPGNLSETYWFRNNRLRLLCGSEPQFNACSSYAFSVHLWVLFQGSQKNACPLFTTSLCHPKERRCIISQDSSLSSVYKQTHLLKVVSCWEQLRCRLVGYWPHHDRWPVLIPADQLLHHHKMMLQRLVPKALT